MSAPGVEGSLSFNRHNVTVYSRWLEGETVRVMCEFSPQRCGPAALDSVARALASVLGAQVTMLGATEQAPDKWNT